MPPGSFTGFTPTDTSPTMPNVTVEMNELHNSPAKPVGAIAEPMRLAVAHTASKNATTLANGQPRPIPILGSCRATVKPSANAEIDPMGIADSVPVTALLASVTELWPSAQ